MYGNRPMVGIVELGSMEEGLAKDILDNGSLFNCAQLSQKGDFYR